MLVDSSGGVQGRLTDEKITARIACRSVAIKRSTLLGISNRSMF